MINKRVNINDMLWLRRPYKAVSLDWCILSVKIGEIVDFFYIIHYYIHIGPFLIKKKTKKNHVGPLAKGIQISQFELGSSYLHL